jgi:transcription factor C subunit 6
MLFQRLYELDYDEASAAYRMTHDFVAEASGLEEATSKASHNRSRTKGARAEASAPTAGDPATVKTGAWRAAVGVHRVAWQAGSGLARAGWLASCSKSGIVRVENLRGKWLYQAK